MIKINLANSGGGSTFSLSGGEAAEIITPEQTRKEFIKRLLIMLIFPAGLWVYQSQNLPVIQQQLSEKNKILSQLQEYNGKSNASVAEIKKFKEDEAKIQARIAIIEKISKDRLKEIHVLDLIQQVIPEKVWFSEIQVVDSKMTIIGFALSDFDISSFMEAISKSIFLSDVNLINSNEQIVEGVSVKKFEISCTTEKSQ